MEIKPFEKKIWLASPYMHGEELEYVKEAYETNWMSTVGENINQVEKLMCEKIGCKSAVALSSGTSALHLAVKLAGERVYGQPKIGKGCLAGKQVFCSDLTFAATVNPVVYEGGEPVFIDSEYETWNMDPEALERAFNIYPEVKIVVLVHLYGTPAKIQEIKSICERHNAILIEDAAESFGATYNGVQTGNFGDYSVVSFNGNKIVTGSSGGVLLSNDNKSIDKARKWSTQSRESAAWYQHEEIGYNYRMSNVIAGVVRGQLCHLEEHIEKKKEIYYRYLEGFKELPITMNPFAKENAIPNYWLSCILIDKEAICKEVKNDNEYIYVSQNEKSCPMEIYDTLLKYNIESRPVWKPMHLQPLFRNNCFVTKIGIGNGCTNAYIYSDKIEVGTDIYNRGLCLPSDCNMSEEQQSIIIDIVRACFK